jgi:hypothetical protein
MNFIRKILHTETEFASQQNPICKYDSFTLGKYSLITLIIIQMHCVDKIHTLNDKTVGAYSNHCA